VPGTSRLISSGYLAKRSLAPSDTVAPSVRCSAR
jgi:hypothetical protein